MWESLGIFVELDSAQFSYKSQNNCQVQIVTCDPHDLRPHASYTRHNLTASHCSLSALRDRGELAFREPLTISRDRTIIDGYARWQLAKELKLPFLRCIEYELSETEALQWLIRKHGRANGLNAFSRIMLALDLELELTEKARANNRIGGQQKGWSNLTKAEVVHVRSEIAKAAVVSIGNVTKVKQLNAGCVPEITDALYGGEVSIHWAWKLRAASAEGQLDALGRFRFEKGLLKDVRKLAARRKRTSSTSPLDGRDLLNRLTQVDGEKLESIGVEVIKGTRHEIFVTEELAKIIGLEQLRLWNQGAVYNNSPKPPESFGTSGESARRSATI